MTDAPDEGGFCGDCRHCRGVDERRDVCRCAKRNPHRDWRYRNNEPCPEWASVFEFENRKEMFNG